MTTTAFMNSNTPFSDKEILEFFEVMQEKAKIQEPSLLDDIKSFTDNHVVLEAYQSYMNALNQPPTLTTSNFVR